MLLKSIDGFTQTTKAVTKGVLRHPLQVLLYQHRNYQKQVGQKVSVKTRIEIQIT